MGWGKVAEYILAFGKWCWENKFTIIFIITTIVFMSMYGCEKMKTKKLTDNLTVEKAKVAQCEANYNTVVHSNKEMELSVDACHKELEVAKESYAKAEEITKQFDEEIKKYKDIAKQIDAETDADKQLEMKKKILEEVFKGKRVYQIMLNKKRN